MTPNLLVFIPAFRNQVTASTMLTTHALSQACWQRGIGFAITSMTFPCIEDIRAFGVTYFYDYMKEATHLLFLDDDMAFGPELVFDMLMFNQPVVGANYPKRALPLQFTASGPKDAEVRGGFLKVDGIGMGCTLIRRDAIEVMLEKMPEISDERVGELTKLFGGNMQRVIRAFEPVRSERGKMSEDFSFCQRWRDCGGEVWAACHHTVTHIGQHAFEGNFREWSIQKGGEQAAQQAAE